ncbi:glycosyl hydrolase family 18 protein [Rhizohabitans arisaemae]|uniref:glycosyl hydrolase family 18 protein n=1 Tax=Rhizohabitans arisaemae TaxID=2720610 RepID=UPI0024B0782F|nr:glycosyl hydrolase family 18 protein [Rhizohabitans arisaemae]
MRRTSKVAAGLVALVLPLTAVVLSSPTASAASAGVSVAALAPAWAPNTAYTTGTIVTYNGVDYRCRQNHTSLPGWEPSNVPALWEAVTTGGDPIAPSVPQNLRSGAPSTSSTISLAWNASTDNVGVTGYEVSRGGSPLPTVTGTTFTDSGLNADTPYTYTVRARDAAGNWSAVSTSVTIRTAVSNDPIAPSIPQNLRSGGPSSSSTISLAWNASTDNVGVTGYEVSRGGSPLPTVTGTTFTDSGLSPDTPYTYTVRARDAAGNWSGQSTSVTLRTDRITPGGSKVLGYFVSWGIYARNYKVKNIDTSGSAAKLTHINYAFGNVSNGQCVMGDRDADIDRAFTAAESVDGVGDSWDPPSPLKGNFNQLRKLKAKYPHLKILWSFGGWTWSGGFGQAVSNPTAFADSCYRLVEDPRWADIFDGIDLDWEYPNACGLTCDTTGFASFKNMMQAMRARFGPSNLVTAAITADGRTGGKIDAADYAGAAQYVDWYNVMTYDFFGAWAATGPTAPHSPLTGWAGQPIAGFDTDTAIQKLKSKNIPANKLLLGIGFYGRGWTGVTQATPGGTATGPAPGIEPGNEDYKVLKVRCPVTGTVAGTAYAKCGNEWWSYDTPSTIAGKMTYTKNQGLGGAFFWELSGDTTNAELLTALKSGLG